MQQQLRCTVCRLRRAGSEGCAATAGKCVAVAVARRPPARPPARLTSWLVVAALQGLRERNWTSKYYDPAAEKWGLQFFQDRWAAAAAAAAAVAACLPPLMP